MDSQLKHTASPTKVSFMSHTKHEIATPQSSPIKSAKKPSIELDRESRHALEGFMLASQMY
eukprot:CAMPEP_0182854398 /NCGR_PEP_ID=MMETSP0034_2-20130328/1229_1 /TAXON_ID=156128 /ORGANISM="Nephroselmis pyriformis, Strain CCMP717" /LENGTH=60 /DNA_ID=CAMNT_0024985227 /DNA_START=365 /DNA_END=547 /DNA_ORIENTATION=+